MASPVQLPLQYTAYAANTLNAPIEKVTQTVSSLASDEVLIKVNYSSLNPMDDKIRQYNFFHLPLPIVCGFDIGGTVVAVGDKPHNHLAVGDEVFGFLPTGGGFAEYVKTNSPAIVKRGSIPAKEGSTYGVAYLTTYEALYMIDDLRKRKGQSIYIPGIAGGCGHFAVQLAKEAGLIVYGSGSKPQAEALAKQYHVDKYIDYRKHDIVKEILSATHDKGVDLVWDSTYSPESYIQSASVIAKGGRWMKLGTANAQGPEVAAIVEKRGATVQETDYGRHWAPGTDIKIQQQFAQALNEAAEFYKAGKVKPHVSKVYSFDAKSVAEGMELVGNSKSGPGKEVVEVSKA